VSHYSELFRYWWGFLFQIYTSETKTILIQLTLIIEYSLRWLLQLQYLYIRPFARLLIYWHKLPSIIVIISNHFLTCYFEAAYNMCPIAYTDRFCDPLQSNCVRSDEWDPFLDHRYLDHRYNNIMYGRSKKVKTYTTPSLTRIIYNTLHYYT